MFGGKKEYVGREQVETILGSNTAIQGNIKAKGSIRIDGQLDGELRGEADVVVGDTGKLKANIYAKSMTIAGEVVGNIQTQEKLELLSSAKVYGDVKVGSIIIGEGAVFQGACDMKKEQEVTRTKAKDKA